jgi:hypothetical protein
MKNNYFLKNLLPTILFCLFSSFAFCEGFSDLRLVHNEFKGAFEKADPGDKMPDHSADVIIRGTVRDENGVLSGATIRENGTKNSTMTRENGTFSLKVSKANAFLTISFVGYESSEVALEGRTVIEVVLKATSNELSNIVILATSSGLILEMALPKSTRLFVPTFETLLSVLAIGTPSTTNKG